MCGDDCDHVSGLVLFGPGMLTRSDPDSGRVAKARCAILAIVKAWHAALAAFLLVLPQASTAADDLSGAARELARKTSSWSRGSVAVTYRNLSSLPETELAHVRREFEAALVRPPENGPAAEARLTLSESASQFLLVEEARSGEDAQVWVESWNRAARPALLSSGAVLERKVLWEQDGPVLDVAAAGGRILVLTPSAITLQGAPGGSQTAAVTPSRPWPRDLRGHLRISGDRLQAFLPGLVCNGSVEPRLSVDCRPGEEPWVLESGSRAILLANFTPDRNYFDGRVVMQTGEHRSVAPFYTAAALEEGGATMWLMALVDGRAQLLDSALQPVSTVASWGSDIVGIDAGCAGGSAVLATHPGESDEPDAIQAFSLTNRVPTALAPPVTFPGPVTALWPAGPDSALAVARDLASGKYTAYVLTLACGP